MSEENENSQPRVEIEEETSEPIEKKQEEKLTKLKLLKLSRRKRLSWERFRAGIQWNFYVYIFILSIVIVLLFVSAINILEDVESETEFLAHLIAIILLFQVLMIYVQTINQYKSNRIAKIGFLPHISVYSKQNLHAGISSDLDIEIGIRNSGTIAHNVGYGIKIDKKLVNPDVPLFILNKDDEFLIHHMSWEDFKNKQIDVHIKFEDMIKSPPYVAIFRKEANEDSFKTLSTGLY